MVFTKEFVVIKNNEIVAYFNELENARVYLERERSRLINLGQSFNIYRRVL